jgi:hypothetical protein
MPKVSQGGVIRMGGDISYEQLNTYEHDKMSGHKKSPPIMMGTMLINILLVS